MRSPTRAAILAACMIAGQALAAQPEGNKRMSASLVQERREMLLAQCRAPRPRATEEETGYLPIHVTPWGDHGPVVLVVHGGVQGGLGGGPSTFSGQRGLADRGWRLAVVDRPGFGQSPSRGVDDMEADSAWIADMLGDGAFLIGHSWGGAEALLAAARRPQAVRGLILIEPALQSLLMGDPRVGKDPALLASAQQFGGILLSANTPADYALGFARSLGAVGAEHAPNTAVAALEHDARLAHGYGCALLQARMAPPPTLREAATSLSAAHVRVLVITGGWSPFFDGVGQLAAELTGGRHVIVPSANHFVQLTNAERFNAEADTFMREIEAADELKGR